MGRFTYAIIYALQDEIMIIPSICTVPPLETSATQQRFFNRKDDDCSQSITTADSNASVGAKMF
jgi:hypothetical protein